MLDLAGLASDAVVGTETIRGKRFTAEKLAVNAVMAGCRPEYFPVVVATIAACLRASLQPARQQHVHQRRDHYGDGERALRG